MSERQARCLNKVMTHDVTVIVHSLGEATAALAEAQAQGRGVTLVSAPEQPCTPAAAGGKRWWPRPVADTRMCRARTSWTAQTVPGRRWRRCGSGWFGWCCGRMRQAARPPFRSPNRWAGRFCPQRRGQPHDAGGMPRPGISLTQKIASPENRGRNIAGPDIAARKTAGPGNGDKTRSTG